MNDPDVIPTLPAPPSIRETVDVPTRSEHAALKARKEEVERKATRSRLAELVALVTVIASMSGACASAASSISHDVAAARMAEAKRSCP